MLEKSIKDLNLDDRMYLAIHEYKAIIICFTALLAFTGVFIFYAILMRLSFKSLALNPVFIGSAFRGQKFIAK